MCKKIQYENLQVTPLYPVKEEIYQLRNDDLGKDVLRIIKEKFAEIPAVVLDKSFREHAPIGYSNTFRRFAWAPAVKELYGDNIKLFNPALSEIALRNGTLPDADITYEDFGVVVYSLDGANSQLAKHLIKEAKSVGVKVRFPMVFCSLKTVKDSKFPDGVRLDLDGIAGVYHVPILREDSALFDAENKSLIKNGFPSKLGSGSRTLYTASDGLRRLCRGRGPDLFASDDNLPFSFEAGRVSFLLKPQKGLEDRTQ